MLELLQQALELFQLLLLLEENGHDHGLKRPWTSDHDSCLDMQLRAMKEPVEDRLIGFGKCPLKWSPATAFVLNELAERRERLAHGITL